MISIFQLASSLSLVHRTDHLPAGSMDFGETISATFKGARTSGLTGPRLAQAALACATEAIQPRLC